MSYYRIYQYDNAIIPYKHIYIKRDRKVLTSKTIGNSEIMKSAIKNDVNISRAKRIIKDLILCNDWDYFCTFTFKPDRVDRSDLKSCYSVLTEFFKNYRKRKSSDFRYLIIPEKHKDGSYHFHGVVRGIAPGDLVVPDTIIKRVGGELKNVPNTPGYLLWKSYHKNMGLFNCSPIKSVSACAFYITKYISKELASLPVGVHLYTCSKGLKRPELVLDEDNYPMFTGAAYENEFVRVAYEHMDYTCKVLNDFGIDKNPFDGEFCTPEPMAFDNYKEVVLEYEQTKMQW